jgi:2-phosphoglycerate kinase
MFDPAKVRRDIRKLQARGHEVMVVQVRDPNVENFPFNRWVNFESLERPGVRWRIDTVPLKRFYLEEYREFTEEWKNWARKHDVHLISLGSDQSVETILSKYLTVRASGGHGL